MRAAVGKSVSALRNSGERASKGNPEKAEISGGRTLLLQFTSWLNTRRSRTRQLAVAIGFAVIAATISLPLSPAHANHAAVDENDSDCKYSSDPVGNSNRIRQNYYEMKPWDERWLGRDLKWTEDPFRDDSWQNTLHTLTWTLDLLQAAKREDDGEVYENRLYEHIKDWWFDNYPHPKSRWAWSDHSTARRAIVLVCVNDALEPEGSKKTLIDQMLKKHGEVLLRDDFYVKYGNHALDQSIALLEIGRVLNSGAFKNKAAERLNDYVGRSVDSQGVMNEQSVGYQKYNHSRYVVAMKRLIDAHIDPGPNFDRVALMPNFLVHATLPTGTYEMLGDTQDSPGTTSPATDRTVARYNAGFLFARSGWGRDGIRAARDETFFSSRWGPGPVLHGHADGLSLTLASWGSRLLIDSGLYRYGSDPFRVYMRSRAAHNVVTVDGALWNEKVGSGRVIDNTLVSNKYVDLELRVANGYPGVTHTRRITYSRALDYLIVDDRLTSTTARTYRQLWHLGWDANPVVDGRVTRTRKSTGNLLIAQLYGRTTSRVVKGQTSPIQGWTSYRYGKLSKTPTIEAIQQGRSVRYITLLAPAKYQPKPDLKSFKATSGGYDITLRINGKTERLITNGKNVGAWAIN